jgi:hypothetical protein
VASPAGFAWKLEELHACMHACYGCAIVQPPLPGEFKCMKNLPKIAMCAGGCQRVWEPCGSINATAWWLDRFAAARSKRIHTGNNRRLPAIPIRCGIS